LVSHDRYFVDALASHVWALEPETASVTVIKGGYSNYLAFREAGNGQISANGTGQSTAQSKSQMERAQTKAEKRALEKKARQMAEIENRIEATEAKLAELAGALEAASQSQDVPQLQALGQTYPTTEAELEALLTRWTEMELT